MSHVNSKGKEGFALNVVSCIILILVSLIPIRISPLPTPKTNVKKTPFTLLTPNPERYAETTTFPCKNDARNQTTNSEVHQYAML